MNKVSRALLSAIAATTLIWSCVESAPPDNDDTDSQRGNSTREDAGTGDKNDAKADDGDDEADDGNTDETDDGNTDDGNTDDGNTDDGNTDDGNTDDGNTDDGNTDDGNTDDGDGMMSEDDAGTDEPLESKIKGTAIEAGCSSYGPEADGMCAGFYCGVTEDDIEAELDSSVCTGATARSVCSGELTTDVATCARDIKTANIGASTEVLRGLVEECVYGKKTKYEAEVPKACLGCFLDAAECASKYCVDDPLNAHCLFGDSAACDKCRQDNKCNEPVMKCGDLPSPF